MTNRFGMCAGRYRDRRDNRVKYPHAVWDVNTLGAKRAMPFLVADARRRRVFLERLNAILDKMEKS